MDFVGWVRRSRNSPLMQQQRWWGYADANPPYAPAISMQPEHAVDGAQLGRLDQLGMGHRDRIQRTFQLFLPEAEKILQRRKLRKQIVVLPDIGLQQRGMIRHSIKNLSRRQTITQTMLPEIVGNSPNPRDHANLHCWSAFHVVAAPSHPGGDALT